MSGGSHNYIYNKLSVECEGEMHDAEMDDLIKDLCEVLHDLEWWQSGDYSEDQYRETVSEFKKKWFKSDRTSRLIKSYIIDQLDAVKSQLISLIGEEEAEFHCGVEESGGHAYNCNDCPNKCEEWYQWDKEMKNE